MLFEGSFLTTGIGSFPHTDGDQAFRVITEHFSRIPFWPQLPKRSFFEGMVVQYAEGFPSIRWDEREHKIWVDTSEGFDRQVELFYQAVESNEIERFAITETFSKGFQILINFAQQRQSERIECVKGQITGPITFGLSLTDQERKPIFYDPTLREILIDHLSFKARWMERRFNQFFPGAKTILFFDEPSLSAFGSAFSSLNREEVVLSLNQCFAAVHGLKGVHCCGNTDWSLLFDTNVDILSFDAYGFLDTISLYPRELEAFLERGGVLAWGLIPSNEAISIEDPPSLVRRFKAGAQLIQSKGIDSISLKRGILTPSCGLASLPIPLAERVCSMTTEVSKRLRDLGEGDLQVGQ